MSKWLNLIKSLAPFILATVPGIPPLLVPVIVHGIEVAESIPGATGPQKKASVLELVQTGVETTNTLAKHQVLDVPATVGAVSSGIDATIQAVKAIQSFSPTSGTPVVV